MKPTPRPVPVAPPARKGTLAPPRHPAAPYALAVTYVGYNGRDGRPLVVPTRFATADERAAVVEGMRRCYALKPYTLTVTGRDAHGVCALAVEADHAGGTAYGAAAEPRGGRDER